MVLIERSIIMKCEVCGKEHDGSYGSGRFCSKHCRMSYIGSQNKSEKSKLALEKYRNSIKAPLGTWKCNRCGLVFETRAKLFEHGKIAHPYIGNWNKGKTKFTDKSIADQSKHCHQHYEEGKFKIWCEGQHLSNEMKESIASGMRHSRTGKYRGMYKGYHFDSTWELAYIIYNIDHNIPFDRNAESFEWVDPKDNSKHLYYPDFIENESLIEIKGYKDIKAEIKFNTVKNVYKRSIIMIDKDAIGKYLDYVTEHYGKDFLKITT